ncbi:MAG TPA: hypothetical protein ACFYD6_00490 [Candidatus Brocadiia bacterium]|nr:hypothetical protein [Candidatus Brocadiales bacterium]
MKKERVNKAQWIAVIFFVIITLVCIFSGCSSMSIAKQKKFAMLVGQQIEFIGNEVIAKCNDGTIKEDDCILMANLINFALDSQNAYTRALIAMQNGTSSQEQVQKALETLQDDMATLVSNAISLGISIRKD